MCDQQSLRPACAYVQSDQSLCLSLEYSMTLRPLTKHLLEFLRWKWGCTGSSESTLVKMPNGWKSHVTAHFCMVFPRWAVWRVGRTVNTVCNHLPEDLDWLYWILFITTEIIVPSESRLYTCLPGPFKVKPNKKYLCLGYPDLTEIYGETKDIFHVFWKKCYLMHFERIFCLLPFKMHKINFYFSLKNN